MKAKLGLAIGAGVALVALIWFATIWFKDPGHKKIPVMPPSAVIQREADELRAAVTNLEAQAQDVATSLARKALADGYLSVQEEREVPQRALADAEEIKTRAPYPAVIEGFTFVNQRGGEIKVDGLRFDSNRAVEILENEFRKRGTAVKERELIERLRSLLKANAQDDQWLDDKEAESVLRFISTPEPGKEAGLKRAVATATIDSFCKENRVGRGPRPEGAPR